MFTTNQGRPSLFGSLDLLTLCVVGAGVCASQILHPSPLLPLARRGLAYNLLAGDFVEAAYPFMDRDPVLKSSCYFASALSGFLVVRWGLFSTAYLPLPLSLVIAEQGTKGGVGSGALGLAGVATLAFFVPFLVGVLRGKRDKKTL